MDNQDKAIALELRRAVVRLQKLAGVYGERRILSNADHVEIAKIIGLPSSVFKVLDPEYSAPQLQHPELPHVSPIFGIGDVNNPENAESPTPWPTHGQVCKICGKDEGYGAMFTTIKGSGICDDCI